MGATPPLRSGCKFLLSTVDRHDGAGCEAQIGFGSEDHGHPSINRRVATVKTDGKRTLVFSPELGYGAGAATPPNATLIFEVELLGVR